jgi:hypothetical protein
MIPVLWPIDLINLPRRGPTPTLKPETRLTVLLLEDVGVPTKNEVQHQPEMISRYNYGDNEAQQQAAPIQRAYPQQQTYAPQQQAYAQPYYAQPSPTVVVVQAPAPAPAVIQQQAPPVYVRQSPAMYGYPYPTYPPPGYYYRPY